MQQSCGDRTCISVPVTLKPGSLNKNPCGELNSVYKLFSLHQKITEVTTLAFMKSGFKDFSFQVRS